MNNRKFELPIFNRPETPMRKLLEQTKLSRLPPIPRRAVCENCKGNLDADNEFQNAVKLCRQCLRNYANLSTIIERHTEEKIRRNYRESK